MCIVLVTTPPQHDVKMSNETCKPFHRFPLTEELYVTVCAERNPVLLQINQFENGEPSHRGVQCVPLNLIPVNLIFLLI